MLELKNIVKEYYTQDETVRALDGVSLKFRKSEFVSILGPSGCGKTTLLNIVGGLDRYNDGDLVINGKSTKDYTDKEWDTYRNHSVGFVFQSYNLIPHQTVLENVELALTLSGIGKEERRQRAKAVLEKVGLGNKLKSRPNQLSGGQMQRVAIARALINDPEILLADEPTGALDSKTSEQIMELLKEISHDRLIVMVTHNPELAESYSTRIIRMLDGKIVEDPNPVTEEEEKVEREIVSNETRTNKGKNKTSMSFKTALSLSLKNLLTKKARTILVSFAGSIGIIGIALILSLSSGFQSYINKVQSDTLSNYPVTIQAVTTDMNALAENMAGVGTSNKVQYPTDDKIYANETLGNLIGAMDPEKNGRENDLAGLKTYIEEYIKSGEYDPSKISDIQYTYDIKFTAYGDAEYDKTTDLVPLMSAFEKLEKLMGYMGMGGNLVGSNMMSSFMNFDTWSEAIGNVELLKSQYDLVGTNSRWPDFNSENEVILVLDSYNQIPDYILSALGFIDPNEILYPLMKDSVDSSMLEMLGIKEVESKSSRDITVEKVLDRTFYLNLESEHYIKGENGGWNSYSVLSQDKINRGREVKIVGVVRPKEGVTGGALSTSLIYTKALTNSMIKDIENSEIIQLQLANKEKSVDTGKAFKDEDEWEEKLKSLGYVDKKSPASISFYAVSFEDKDYIAELIDDYNDGKSDKEKIVYNDFLGTMMSGVTDIVDAVSYVLIGFVSVSLIVSSIMIGVITYISVLERIKEIGILRALGASKKDVSRVFNAETLIIGLAAGLLGIGITVILNIPISYVIYKLAEVRGVAKLPWLGGIILVVISMGLTLLAGLIPSKIASKKDPVVALRTE